MRDEIETIETTAAEVAAELARRGIGANRHVSLTVEPDDWLARGHQAIRPAWLKRAVQTAISIG